MDIDDEQLFAFSTASQSKQPDENDKNLDSDSEDAHTNRDLEDAAAEGPKKLTVEEELRQRLDALQKENTVRDFASCYRYKP